MKQFILTENQLETIRDNAHKLQGTSAFFEVLEPDQFYEPEKILSEIASWSFTAASKITGVVEELEENEIDESQSHVKLQDRIRELEGEIGSVSKQYNDLKKHFDHVSKINDHLEKLAQGWIDLFEDEKRQRRNGNRYIVAGGNNHLFHEAIETNAKADADRIRSELQAKFEHVVTWFEVTDMQTGDTYLVDKDLNRREPGILTVYSAKEVRHDNSSIR